MESLEIKVPIMIVRDSPFYCYRSAKEEVMATVTTTDIELDLAEGRVQFPAGSYELIHADGTCTFMNKIDFEEEYKLVEDPQNVTVTPITTIHEQKEGGEVKSETD